MANPSETYAVDSTLTFGTTEVNLTKDLSTLFPTLNSEIDNSISINALNDDLVKTVYRKSDKYNSLFDESITFSASPAGGSDVVKYYARNAYPADSVNITNAIVYGSNNNENRVYATGYSGDASSIYNANSGGSLKFIRDLDYNKILFAITAKEYSSIPVLAKGTIDYNNTTHATPTASNIDLKDIDPNKYYMGYESNQAKIWNGSGWSNINARPILVCNGDTVQSIQSAGTAFYSEIPQYGMVMSSGGNVSISISSTNQLNFGYNFCNVMDRAKYTLGWSDSYSTIPNWADIHDNIFAEIDQHMIDNNQNSMSCTISREIVSVSDNMSILISVVGTFYRNSTRIYAANMNCMFYPLVKGSALLKLLAGFGCYYIADSSADISELTPDTLHNSSAIWLGAMSSDGTTTGTWIKGADIENYTGYNKDGNTNNPNFDPSGGGGGGQDDDPWHGVDFGGSSGGGGAFAKFYYMTSTELANLRSWMNSNSVPEGFNPMAQIIGLSQVPVAISGSAPENVVFVNSAAIYDEGQNRVVDSGVATQRGLGSSIIYNLGSVKISRRMKDRGEPYLDYSCAVELYLPFCGVFSLDTQAVMGRTITAQLVLDPTSGSITGYAWVENEGEKLPVAYGSGQVGVDLPITAQQYGMSKAALSQANAAFAQSMFQTAIQAMTFAATSGMSSAESAGDAAYARGGRGTYSAVRSAEKSALSNEVGTYVKSQASSNVVGGFLNWGRALKEISYGNNTAVGGSFGGSYASWSNPFTAYVKIIRPKFQKPDNYDHTQAVPCVEAKTVGSCTGLIQCIGVDTSSITNATSIERDAIAAALSNGVYAGGGN